MLERLHLKTRANIMICGILKVKHISFNATAGQPFRESMAVRGEVLPQDGTRPHRAAGGTGVHGATKKGVIFKTPGLYMGST